MDEDKLIFYNDVKILDQRRKNPPVRSSPEMIAFWAKIVEDAMFEHLTKSKSWKSPVLRQPR
jgi:hypothetical protein